MAPRSRSASAKRKAAAADEERLAVEARVSLAKNDAADDGPTKLTPEKDPFRGEYDFGGPLGVFFIMVFSHAIMYYVVIAINQYGGQMIYPGHPALGGENFFAAMKRHAFATCVPSMHAAGIYIAFLVLEWLLAVVMPGPVVLGRSLPSEGGYRHRYKCNAVWAWWTMLAVVLALWKFGYWSVSIVARNYGEFLTASIVIADITAVLIYVQGFLNKRTLRMSGNHLYDFFMGSQLNPKLPLGVDFKMLAELRISWGYLFLITLAHALWLWEESPPDARGIPTGMWLLLLGHFLYCNACQKGEECVPACWDIYHEKFGWLLIFWNMAGVPAFYGVQALFYVKVRTASYVMPPTVWAPVLVVLLVGYFMFDTANGQKNRFRLQREGVPDALLYRKTFPFLPWGHIENPRTLKRKVNGVEKELFTDGWMRVTGCRKISYTGDNMQALCWGLACGVGTGAPLYFMPFFYWFFHFCMLIHRGFRDEHECKIRYGNMWDEYCEIVPYRYIPYVF